MSGTRKLGRPSDHRMAMLRGMVTYLLENGQIETTVTRAKEVRAAAEKMITIAKEKNDRVLAMRQIMAYVTKEDVAKKLVDEIGPRYADRKGGYTQIVKIGPRRGDAAESGHSCDLRGALTPSGPYDPKRAPVSRMRADRFAVRPCGKWMWARGKTLWIVREPWTAPCQNSQERNRNVWCKRWQNLITPRRSAKRAPNTSPFPRPSTSID